MTDLCFFPPNSVCFRNCGCLWQRDAAASRGNDVTSQPISVSKMTFKSTREPQLSTLRGVWRSNYYSENHVTHTSIMIGQQDWWPWQLPLSDSPKRTRGGEAVRNNSTIWRVLPWRLREKQRQESRGSVSGILSGIPSVPSIQPLHLLRRHLLFSLQVTFLFTFSKWNTKMDSICSGNMHAACGDSLNLIFDSVAAHYN